MNTANPINKPSEGCIQLAVSAWQKPETEMIQMDTRLATAFAEIISELWGKPWLGNATTGQLLDELEARRQINGTLDDLEYKTYKGDVE